MKTTIRSITTEPVTLTIPFDNLGRLLKAGIMVLTTIVSPTLPISAYKPEDKANLPNSELTSPMSVTRRIMLGNAITGRTANAACKFPVVALVALKRWTHAMLAATELASDNNPIIMVFFPVLIIIVKSVCAALINKNSVYENKIRHLIMLKFMSGNNTARNALFLPMPLLPRTRPVYTRPKIYLSLAKKTGEISVCSICDHTP